LQEAALQYERKSVEEVMEISLRDGLGNRTGLQMNPQKKKE
jgi:hypothetical protein